MGSIMEKRLGFLSLDISNTFNELLYESIYKKCLEYNYQLFTIHGGRLKSDDQWEKQRNIIYKWIINEKFDGLIVSNIFDFIDDDEAQQFLSGFPGIPIVLISKKLSGYYSIIVNNISGFEVMLNSILSNHNAKNIAVITGPTDNTDTIQRMETLRKILNAKNLVLNDNAIYNGTFNFFDGVNGVTYFIDSYKFPIDIIICFNDNMALGALQELKKRGINIPHEIRVTGFDNTLESFFMSPALTTASYPLSKLGIEAVEMIHSLINNKIVPENKELQTYYIPRKSTETNDILIPSHFTNDSTIYTLNFNVNNKVLRDFFEKIITQYNNIIEVDKKEWLFNHVIAIMKLITDPNKVNTTIDFMEKNIFNSYKNEWSYPILMELLQKIDIIFKKKIDSITSTNINAQISKSLLLSYYHYSCSIIQKNIYSRIIEEQLFQLGEDLSTAFNRHKILSILSEKLPLFTITKCFIVAYSNNEKTKAKLIGYINNGSNISVSQISDFDPADLLPAQFKDEIYNGFIEALHVKDEDIGYIIINNGINIGITVKSLRHQISGALKGTMLVETINQYSENMEKKVKERTKDLEIANAELQSEIEKRERLEKSLLKNKNLESLGLLAGGIAHDFNNYLTGILANISIIKRNNMKTDDLVSCINDIESVARNAIGLTQQLLTFSKGGSPIKQNTSIIPLIEEISRFLLRGSSIKPQFTYSDTIKNVDIDQNQISQVLHNIIINAIHAMSGKGLLKINLDVITIETINETTLKQGEYLVITIEDTGTGIDEKCIDKIFDPYFSTKAEGSGLGLATSLTIVRKHDGDITVKSIKNQGTIFTIYLPAVEKEKTVYNKVRSTERLNKTLNILILEDDPIILKVLCKMLEVMGHHYTATSDGRETIKKYDESCGMKNHYDLLILDLTIVGGLGGKETIQEIRKKNSVIKAIVSSGYSEESVLSEYKEYGFNSILQKPYTLSDIEKALQSVFNE